ncbi:MAG: DNA polymerase III subunit alpha, partial [Planctomycetaceae bacterium]
MERLVGRTVELGMNALAITDHGNLHGALEFYQAAKAAGINPVIGYEAYIAPGSRFQKDAGSQKDSSFHLTLLAKDRTGFDNLLQLATKAYLEGFYFKPRIDRELLEHYSDGLICLSGCLSSEFSRALIGTSREQQESLARARDIVGWFRNLFGDRYFIEIQDNGLDLQRQITDVALELSREMGVPPVATCDCHYVNREDAEAQDILLCVNTGRFRNDAGRMKMDSTEFYLKSPAEMHAAFDGLDRSTIAAAVTRSQEIADSVSIDLDLGKRHFPGFDVPGGRTASEELRRLCLEGLRERYQPVTKRWVEGIIGGELHPDVMSRLDRELGVIDTLGFSSYFLIVWDFVEFARRNGIPCGARGSACGAIVAYLLRLGDVCPLKYDLLFERFLDPSRNEPPDIDIDFCRDRRQMVIDYTKQKYGERNVAQIGTYGTLKAKNAIRDVGRALNVPLPRVNELAGMVPDTLNIRLKDALDESADLKAAWTNDPVARKLLDFAMAVEGLARSAGTHAAGVVIADVPLDTVLPLQTITGKEDIVTQWDGPTVEKVGLLKMDFLGL